jgi:hypothetical protein
MIYMNKRYSNKLTLIFTGLILILLISACFNGQTPSNGDVSTPPDSTQTPPGQDTDNQPAGKPEILFVMKGVGIDIPPQDFRDIKEGGIDILTTEWGMEVKVEKARAFLNEANNAGLKVVMDAGFSYLAWGFTEQDWNNLPAGKRPEWQQDKVQQWVNEFKGHPAVYGWDICNEFGENLPSGAFAKNTQWPKTAITLEQLSQARADVLQIDSDKPVMIRMNQQSFEEPFGGIDNNFAPGIAEIVMLNLYSNYMKGDVVQWPGIINDIAQSDVDILENIDPATTVWIALGAFEQSGSFKKPTPEHLLDDIEDTLQLSGISTIGFFSWGPSTDYTTRRIWYLPESAPDLWKLIKFAIEDYKQTG